MAGASWRERGQREQQRQFESFGEQLAAASPELDAMLSSGMVESEDKLKSATFNNGQARTSCYKTKQKKGGCSRVE